MMIMKPAVQTDRFGTEGAILTARVPEWARGGEHYANLFVIFALP